MELKKLLPLILLLLSPFSEAYFIYPQGFHELLTANTGVARTESIGSVIYNPAGLAFDGEANSLSLSGSVLSNESFLIKRGAYSDGFGSSQPEDLNAEPRSRQTPGLFIGGSASEYGRYGYFIHSDSDFQIQKYFLVTGALASYSWLIDAEMVRTSVGGFFATKLTESTQLGATLRITSWNSKSNAMVKGFNSAGSFSNFTHTVESGYSASARLGLIQSFGETSSFGLYVEPKGASINGNGFKVDSSVSTAGDVTDNSNDYKTSSPNPTKWGLGFGKTFGNWKSYFDYDLTEAIESSTQNELTVSKRNQGIGLGFEVRTTPEKVVMFGVRYYLDYMGIDSKAYLVTGGIKTRISFLDVITGAFYSHAEKETLQKGNDTESGYATDTFGLVFSTAFNY